MTPSMVVTPIPVKPTATQVISGKIVTGAMIRNHRLSVAAEKAARTLAKGVRPTKKESKSSARTAKPDPTTHDASKSSPALITPASPDTRPSYSGDDNGPRSVPLTPQEDEEPATRSKRRCRRPSHFTDFTCDDE